MSENKSNIDTLYEAFTGNFINEISTNEFYDYFINTVHSSERNFSFNEKYVERVVDLKWVEAIEKTIIPLDNIIRNPNRYIKREEDVVPIEMAREISIESVRHLAQHTNMIAMVKGDEVTPNHILNIIKEESYDTYENRFIYTLLNQLQFFIDRRLRVLSENSKMADSFAYKLTGKCETQEDVLNYDFNMNFVTPHKELDDDILLFADTTKMSAMDRVERVRRIIYLFQSSEFIKSLYGCVPVRSPLTMTNVLKKNQNFISAVELWNFINSYEDVGYSMNFIDKEVTLGEDEMNQFYSLTLLQYVLMKKYIRRTEDVGDLSQRKQFIAPNVIKNSIEHVMKTFNLSIDEVRNVFINELDKKERKREAQFSKARGIISRAIEAERALAAEEERKRKEKEEREKRRLAEEKRKEKLRLEREKARAEKERLKAETEEKKRLEKEARERKRAEEEKAKEQRRLEREKERLRREQERAEQERLKAEKAEQERLAAEKAEQERLAAEKAKQERLAAEKAEKERLAAEKAEQERLAAEKAEQERLAAEKAEQERLAAEEAEKLEEAMDKVWLDDVMLNDEDEDPETDLSDIEEALKTAEIKEDALYLEDLLRIRTEMERVRKYPRKKKKAIKRKYEKELEDLSNKYGVKIKISKTRNNRGGK